MEEAFKILSKNDIVHLLELINLSLSCQTEEELRKLISKVNFLIPFDFAACGLAQMKTGGEIKSYDVFDISFPTGWFDIYLGQKLYEIDPVFKKNFVDFSVQFWADTYKADMPSREFLSLKNEFGLRDGCTHGVKSLKEPRGSIFSISCKSTSCQSSASRKSAAFLNRIETILIHITPHLHHILSRIEGQTEKKPTNPLSRKELEVLNWIKHGKKSWDISTILGISERTVYFHTSNIMRKLDAVSRPQAIANAILLGLINVD